MRSRGHLGDGAARADRGASGLKLFSPSGKDAATIGFDARNEEGGLVQAKGLLQLFDLGGRTMVEAGTLPSGIGVVRAGSNLDARAGPRRSPARVRRGGPVGPRGTRAYMKSDQAKGAFLKTPIVAAALALVFAAAGCGGGKVDRAAVDAHAQAHEPIYGPLAALHSKDPCSLLTKDEIVAQLELSREASQREALRRRGVSWEISSEEFSQEASRSCQIAWRGTVDGAPFSLGGFTLHLTIADRLRDVLANEPNPKRIPGVGDEAFFLRHAPYARVGDLAIGVNFPKGDEAKAGLALLRIAVQRLRSFVQSSGVSEADRVLLEIEFTSWAWGATHTGFHIDATGNVYRYDLELPLLAAALAIVGPLAGPEARAQGPAPRTAPALGVLGNPPHAAAIPLTPLTSAAPHVRSQAGDPGTAQPGQTQAAPSRLECGKGRMRPEDRAACNERFAKFAGAFLRIGLPVALLLLLIMWLITDRRSAWRRLAELYPAVPLRNPSRRIFASRLVLGKGFYKNTTWLTIDDSHLHVSGVGPSRLWMPTFSVPLSDISATPDDYPWGLWDSRVIRLSFARDPSVRFMVWPTEFEQLAAASEGLRLAEPAAPDRRYVSPQ